MIRKIRRIVSRLYRERFRQSLPSRPRRFAGIPVALTCKWGDGIVSKLLIIFDGDEPGYEQTLVAALSNNVRAGDRIVIVGGGVGVTAVAAAKIAGREGHVVCYEGGLEEFDLVRRTVQLNNVADRVTVRHAVVGEGAHVYGSSENATRIRPELLPECELLELDCEGSELGILSSMTIRPRTVLVETHGNFDAPSAACKELLRKLGYEVSDLGLAEPRYADICINNDVRVLLGSRR